MMMKFKVANEIKGTPVVRMLFRDWNCYQVYLRWAQSGKVFCVTWVESDVFVNIQEAEVVCASGSLDFACCQRLGSHLDDTCIQDVA